MLKSLSAGLDRLYIISGYLAGLLLVSLCLLVTFSIGARMFGYYAGGSTEYAGYSMAASTFLALAYTFRSGGHIRVGILLDRCGVKSRQWMEILCMIIMASAVVFLAWHMIHHVIDSYTYGDRSEGPDALPLWIPQLPMAAGACLFAVSTVHSLIIALSGRPPLGSDVISSEGVQEI